MATNNDYLEKLKKTNSYLYQYFMHGIQIVERLVEKMHEAYIVGGAVRDYLLDKEFKDIDIATSATPKELLEIFPDANTRYSDMGCIEITIDDMVFQITTFRDEQLVTTRKTKDIHYSKKLTDDVLRRDFTVNALALSSNLNVIDIVDGKTDVKRKVVRIIGDGKKRFKEDPLRILRGIELVSRYNFSISFGTSLAMRSSRSEIPSISEHNLSLLLFKILSGEYAKNAVYELADKAIFKDIPVYHEWVCNICRRYKYTNVLEKFALLYYMNGGVPENTHFRSEDIKYFEKLIEMINILKDEQVTPMMIFKHNEELVISANQILVTLGGKYKDQLKKIKKIIEKLPIRSEAELKFSATELIQMMKGYEGPRIKEIMNILLNKVVNLEILNNNSLIRQEALKIVSDLEHKDKKVKEKELDTETMLSVNPLDKNVIPDTVVKEDDVDSLKRDYLLDFKNMFNMFMQDIPGYSEMSDSKKQEIAREVKAKVKESLLATNSKYKKLSEKGIIK